MGRVYEGGLRDSDRMELRTAELAAAAGGHLEGPDVVVDGASQDSRAIAQGQLFVPIVAERDGHEFIAAALANGAAAYLTARTVHGATAIVVPDTAAALQAAGRLARSHLPERVVGVTGSVGKTSVKDLLAAVLARRWTTAASLRSFNNELGVPLTLLNAPDGHRRGGRGDGSPRGGPHRRALRDRRAHRRGRHSSGGGAHGGLRAHRRGGAREGRARGGAARLGDGGAQRRGRAGRWRWRVARRHASCRSASAATSWRRTSPWTTSSAPGFGWCHRGGARRSSWRYAVGTTWRTRWPPRPPPWSSTSTSRTWLRGLGAAGLSPWRMELGASRNGVRVLNDAYNANPTSMVAALEALAALPARRRTAVLGVMAELGPDSAAEHAAIGARARELGIRVVAIDAPGYGGEEVASIADAVVALGDLADGDAVLVKGSRVAGLERLAEILLAG